MHRNALRHDDMLLAFRAKLFPLQLTSHSLNVFLQTGTQSVSLQGVLRPPGPRGPPPAALSSIAHTISWQMNVLQAEPRHDNGAHHEAAIVCATALDAPHALLLTQKVTHRLAEELVALRRVSGGRGWCSLCARLPLEGDPLLQ